MKDNEFILASNHGVSVILSTGMKHFSWEIIEKITAYKVDLMTTDEICFDIVLPETIITISESINGWNSFTDNLEDNLFGFDKEWFLKVVNPPFATNRFTIYSR
jgi:hypothetical protein